MVFVPPREVFQWFHWMFFIYIWLLPCWTEVDCYLSLRCNFLSFFLLLLNLCSLNGSLNQRIVLFYTFVPVEEVPVLTVIMEFLHQKEWLLGWISSCEEQVGGEEALQFSTVPLSVLPFHWYIIKEGKLRSHKIKEIQPWRGHTKLSFCWKLLRRKENHLSKLQMLSWSSFKTFSLTFFTSLFFEM